jgi:UDP-N-acetylglucosamine acyltransferase
VGADVVLGVGNVIGPYAVITGDVILGDNNWIGAHVVIGTPGEHRGFDPDGATGCFGVRIGHSNVVREFTLVNAGTQAPTVIGNECYIMGYSYVAHDCHIADRVTLSQSALGGHIVVGWGANVGLRAAVHQHRRIGPLAMVGLQAAVVADVDPFAVVAGVPARGRGINVVGLRRAGVGEEALVRLSRCAAQKDWEECQALLPPPLADVLRQWRSDSASAAHIP